MIKYCILIFCFFCNCLIAKAQKMDTILLMNGNIVVEKVLDTLIGAVTVLNPNLKPEKLHYEYDQIYCVKYSNGFIDYYYKQDTVLGNYFTREEMEYYIYGERDARKGFKARGSLIGAGIVGLASGGLGIFFRTNFPLWIYGIKRHNKS